MLTDDKIRFIRENLFHDGTGIPEYHVNKILSFSSTNMYKTDHDRIKAIQLFYLLAIFFGKNLNVNALEDDKDKMFMFCHSVNTCDGIVNHVVMNIISRENHSNLTIETESCSIQNNYRDGLLACDGIMLPMVDPRTKTFITIKPVGDILSEQYENYIRLLATDRGVYVGRN